MALGLLLGQGWASGVNLYAVVVLLGLTGRAGWYEAPAILESPMVIGGALALYAIEFVADKIPYVDNLWDVAHTAIRPIGAALVGAALAGIEADVSTLTQALAGTGTGALALASHAAKASARLAINTSPEPASNIVASLAEDSLVAGVVLLAVTHPALAIVAVILLLIAGAAVVVASWKAARAVRSRIAERRRGREPVISRISGRPLP